MPHAGKPLPGGSSIKSAPWWDTWRTKFSSSTQQMSKNWVQQRKVWKKQGKFQMPVHVEMDFLNPAIETVKENTSHFWRQLPPQVQAGAPIVGVALFTAFVVHRVERGKLRAEKERNRRLRGRVDLLLGENEELHMKVADLKGKAQGPRPPSELNMARALSEATQAAAAAATAAAHAASTCRPKPAG